MAKSRAGGRTIEHTGRNVVTIRYPGVGNGFESWVLLRSDVHHDNPHSDRRMEKKHLDEAKKRNALIIDNGDLFCAMQGKYDKRASKSCVRPEHQRSDYLDALVETSAKFYEPYQHLFAVLGRGNHETAIRGRHETDLTDRLSERMRLGGSPVLASGYGGWVVFRFNATTWRKSIHLHHFHGSGGGGPVTRGVITTNRMAVYTPDADIVLTGHSHDEWVVPIRRQRISNAGVPYQDEQIHVRVPGYKDEFGAGEGGWWVETGKAPRPRGAAWLRFWLEFGTNGRKGRNIRYEILRAQ